MKEFTIIERKDGRQYMMDNCGVILRHFDEWDFMILKKVCYYTAKEMRDNRVLAFLLGGILTSFLFIVLKV